MKKQLLTLAIICIAKLGFSQFLIAPDTVNFGEKWLYDSLSTGQTFPVIVGQGPEWEFVTTYELNFNILQDQSRNCFTKSGNTTYPSTHSFSKNEFSVTREDENIFFFKETNLQYTINFTPWKRRVATDQGFYNTKPLNCGSAVEAKTGEFSQKLRINVTYVVQPTNSKGDLRTLTKDIILMGNAVPNKIITGFETVQNNNILFYPNPARDQIIFNGEKVKIYNLSGQQINTIQEQNTIDISSLESGVYIINIDGQHRKLIIE